MKINKYISKNKMSATISHKDDIKWKPFLRQLMVVCSAWTMYFCNGLQFGSTTVLVPQLRRANITVSDEVVSWISSGVAFAAIPWIFLHAVLTYTIGWKKTFILISLATVTANLIFCFSTTPTILFIAEAFFGVPQGATASICITIVSEYTSPQYRGIFLTIKSASFLWGVWLANAIGAFTYWRYIPVIGFIASLNTLTVFWWPESPHWLATKNRLKECRRAHRLMKGNGKSAELELNKLIQSQAEFPSQRTNSNAIAYYIRAIPKREFYLPLLLCMLAAFAYFLSGKFVITAYAVEIIKKIIEDETTVYYTMLVLDGVTVFCAYIGCFITKIYSRRKIWLVTSSLAVVFLLILSLYIYLVKLTICSENVYLSIFLLIGFSVSITCGPMILTFAWPGELILYRYKSVSIVISAFWCIILYAFFIKVSPLIFSTFGLHGTFLFYGLSSGFCTILMYYYLPETKNKTLIEIEEFFTGTKTVEESYNMLS